MDLSKGAKKKAGARTPKQSRGKSKTSKKQNKTRRVSRASKSNRKIEIPKTVKVFSRKSRLSEVHDNRANSAMSITELQFLAKSRGVPFGGLTKTKLIRKINNYY